MNASDIKVCVMRVGGTNCDAETQRAFQELGVQAETVHVNELIKRQNLLEYNVLVFPGGFSFGDYVRVRRNLRSATQRQTWARKWTSS